MRDFWVRIEDLGVAFRAATPLGAGKPAGVIRARRGRERFSANSESPRALRIKRASNQHERGGLPRLRGYGPRRAPKTISRSEDLSVQRIDEL
jgi:hypothetical protein